ncbi:MAG: hypothetical protein ACK4HQ_09505 [Brevinematales bacterium]
MSWGWYPFHKKYQTFRFCLELTTGWRTGNFILKERYPDTIPQETLNELNDIFNSITTGPIFELLPSLEIGLFSFGVSLWIAPRHHPIAGDITTRGIGIFVKTIL